MRRVSGFLKVFIISVLCFTMVGCATLPKGFLKPGKAYLEERQLQMRQYETKDEQKIITSVAGVLQDLGFILDNSETEVGFVAASKKADAVNGGQIAGAIALDVACALMGAYSNSTAQCDKVQVVKASVVTQPSADNMKTVVRVTFQRIVWNMRDQVSRVETITEPSIYQKFYDALSKAIFLEAQKI